MSKCLACLGALVIVVGIAGCGGDNCNVQATCSPSSSAHYQFCNGGGGADDCYYETGDGHKYHCITCGDCAQAQDEVAGWCATQPTTTVGGGCDQLQSVCDHCSDFSTRNSCDSTVSTYRATASGDTYCQAVLNAGTYSSCGGGGNTTGSTTGGDETCTSAQCPSGGRSYQFCSSTGASNCRYKTSDGQTFSCTSCSNCNTAASEVSSWCGGTTSGSTGSTTGSGGDSTCWSQTADACQTCCSTKHSDGFNYYKDGFITCTCASCTTECNASGDYCHGGNTGTSTCSTCLQNAYTNTCSSQLQADCSANAACSAFVSCASSCPTS